MVTTKNETAVGPDLRALSGALSGHSPARRAPSTAASGAPPAKRWRRRGPIEGETLATTALSPAAIAA